MAFPHSKSPPADHNKTFALRSQRTTIFAATTNFTPMKKRDVLEQLHRKMIAEIQDYAIILLDLDGTILSWNLGAEKIKGYKENEILGQNFRLFYMPQDRQAGLPEQLIDLAKKEGRARHIGRRLRKDGSIFWGSILITALHDDDGEVIGFTKLTKEVYGNELS
jgi:PAS domain S-box-containing protein